MNSGNTTPEPRQINPQRRRLLFCLGAVALLIIAFFCARPIYQHFKIWRARRLAAESLRRLAQNDFAEAQEKARAAWLLAPGDAASLRAMAETLTLATNAGALQFWQQLALTGRATDDDRRKLVAQAIRNGNLPPALQELQKLLDASPDQPANLWLASQVSLALGDGAQTLHYATLAQRRDATNLQYQLFLSSIQFDAQEPAPRDAARSNLWALARDRGAVGLDTLNFLAHRPDLRAEQREQLIGLLQGHPLAGVAQQLLALNLQIYSKPAQRAEILDQAAARYKTADTVARIQFAVWLNQNGEFERTLTAVPLEEALKRKDLFLPHVDALASLDRWRELQKLFEKQTPLEEVYVETFRARCELELTNAPLAAFHWKNALRGAERNPEQLMWLALYAGKCNEFETAKKALRSLIGCVENPRPAYQELERVIEHSGTTAELRDLLGEMLKRWPADPALRNDYAYLSLLLNLAVPESRAAAEELVKQSPESLPHRTTLALAWLRENNFPAALRVYDGREIDWSKAFPSQRAVYAAVLAANGRESEAGPLLRNLRRGSLRPEERALIEYLR